MNQYINLDKTNVPLLFLLCFLLLMFMPKIVFAQSDVDQHPLNHANQRFAAHESNRGSDRQPPTPPQTAICTDVNNLPTIECNTLVAFYENTDGKEWTVQKAMSPSLTYPKTISMGVSLQYWAISAS